MSKIAAFRAFRQSHTFLSQHRKRGRKRDARSNNLEPFIATNMGVNSLWKVLDEAGCGKRVGADEISHPKGLSRNARQQGVVNPWNVHRQATTQQQQPQTRQPSRKAFLAVDLSIWICESLSSVMAENHANPAVHLVFARTVRLLSMGIGLVFVIEGKRRIRDAGITKNDQADKFRKRRSGTAFWKACKNCHDMLKLMGVTVVRAKAEAEALCALLNQKGIVDGVISNDGDCLLFGAKVVYTKFSIDNLENRKVMRYEANDLFALVEANDDKNLARNEVTRCKLTRFDLIAFALLTGSDLAGSGLDQVGHKKAVRFIRNCKRDNPLHIETAAIDELKAWARSIAPFSPDPFEEKPFVAAKPAGKCCSHCTHLGSKSDHLKNGCGECGTQPGEPCLEFTAEDRFRQSLREKALALYPKFDPSQVLEAYKSPNDNLLPIQFANQQIPRMERPNLAELMKMKFIVRGRDQNSSRDYIKTSIGRLLSRAELLDPPQASKTSLGGADNRIRTKPNKPVPLQITKRATVGGVASYHVSWRAGATATDNDGNGIGGYEYATVEPQNLVEKRFPKIVEEFIQAEKERMKQGDGEKNRRRAFLDLLCINVEGKTEQPGEKEDPEPSPAKKRRKRQGFLDEDNNGRVSMKHAGKSKGRAPGDDVCKLLRGIKSKPFAEPADNSTIASIESKVDALLEQRDDDKENTAAASPEQRRQAASMALGSPLFCHFGSFLIPISPIEAMPPGEYPPRRIYIHRNYASTR